MVLGLLRGKSPIWWTFKKNAFYYFSALSDPFGNLKYAPKISGTRVSYGIKNNLNRFVWGCLPYSRTWGVQFFWKLTKSAHIACRFSPRKQRLQQKCYMPLRPARKNEGNVHLRFSIFENFVTHILVKLIERFF
jgi:hypothetical protein